MTHCVIDHDLAVYDARICAEERAESEREEEISEVAARLKRGEIVRACSGLEVGPEDVVVELYDVMGEDEADRAILDMSQGRESKLAEGIDEACRRVARFWVDHTTD